MGCVRDMPCIRIGPLPSIEVFRRGSLSALVSWLTHNLYYTSRSLFAAAYASAAEDCIARGELCEGSLETSEDFTERMLSLKLPRKECRQQSGRAKERPPISFVADPLAL
jgi:hypothetical protein